MRWEEEKPFWFTEAWKSRIPKHMLEGIAIRRDRLATTSEQSPESKFRKAVREMPPWSLDAAELATWLETNWVSQEDASDEGLLDR